MAIFTFSTKSKRPEDEELVRLVKEYCEKHCVHFSGVVLQGLAKFKEEKIDGRQN